MKSIIVARNKTHLKELIKQEIELSGNQCDLNHIDVSNITDMDYFFLGSKFKQDVSNWKPVDLKYVKDMFKDCSAPIPYWLDFDTSEEKNHNKMINMLLLKREIELSAVSNINKQKRIKI